MNLRRRALQIRFALRLVLRYGIRWAGVEVGFLILPILVIAAISLAVGGTARELLLRPEWSFAAIAMFGTTLSNLIRIKNNPKLSIPYNVTPYARILLLPLILSVVSFLLAILPSYGVAISRGVIVPMQLGLFVLAVPSALLGEMVMTYMAAEKYELPAWTSRHRFYTNLAEALASAQDDLSYVGYACSRMHDLELHSDGGLTSSEAWNTDRELRIQSLLARVESALATAHRHFETSHGKK